MSLHKKTLIASASVIAFCSANALHASEVNSENSPLFQEAQREFQTMTDTAYKHRTDVHRAAGSYHYDCVGFVSYMIKEARPHAWEQVRIGTGIAQHRIPSPKRYLEFFQSLICNPQDGWEAIPKASELQPGDIVVWEHRTEKASGHAVVIASTPVLLKPGEWLIGVYDSTSSPHEHDSRPDDPRAEILASTGRRGGLGHGMMVFLSDPTTEKLTGLRWNPNAKPLTVPIAAARLY